MTERLFPIFIKYVVLVLALTNFSSVHAQNFFIKELPTDIGSKGVPTYMHPSTHDYKDLADSIVGGCETPYDKIKAIYEWIGNNISYDTSYTIYSADECIEKKTGVCQAYSELFHHLAKAVGVKADLVAGLSHRSSSGHAWVFAYTQKNKGILIDPTWGAGYVNDGVFVRRFTWDWFNVPAKWMIFTHFPSEQKYQLLKEPVTKEMFRGLPPLRPELRKVGLDANQILSLAKDGTLTLPTFYSVESRDLDILEFPYGNTLEVGKTYTFRVKTLNAKDFALISNGRFIRKTAWKAEGDNLYSIEFVPESTGKMSLSIQHKPNEMYWGVMSYEVK